MRKNDPDSRITLVGAGLVGSLLAIFLAKRGYRVEIFERRPDMRTNEISAGRSINLAISVRGLHALNQIGLEKTALQHAIPMTGRMVHPTGGTPALQRYGKDDSECINSISRGTLNKLLMTEAEATGLVQIHFNQRVTGVDLEKNTLRLQNETNRQDHSVQYARLIGTDGSASAVRHAMIDKGGRTQTAETLSHGYKELSIPAGQSGKFQIEKNALHIWPRGSFMLIALPNSDGSFTCTLFLPFEGATSFAQLKNESDVSAFFKSQFPDVQSLNESMIPKLNAEFFENPTGQMVTVKCAPWNYQDRVLLVGDAAHAIVPFFGQGMNCGFEDCTELMALLDAENGDWKPAFEKFSKNRKPHSDAIADMAVENFVEMRDKVADPQFLFEKDVEKILMKEFPALYRSRYSLVTFSRTPYRQAYDLGLAQGRILGELCRGLNTPGEVDLKKAHALIQKELVHGSTNQR